MSIVQENAEDEGLLWSQSGSVDIFPIDGLGISPLMVVEARLEEISGQLVVDQP